MRVIFLFFLAITFYSCGQNNASSTQIAESTGKTTTQEPDIKESVPTIPPQRLENRDTIISILKQKVKTGQPLVVHIFVPLCDNVHQGIVPVNDQLGDGTNLRTNLYWGAGYGVKTHFKRSSNWTFIKSEMNPNEHVLERVIFKSHFENQAAVILVADAYRGDFMKPCLNDFMKSLAGSKSTAVKIDSATIVNIYSGADLLVFNGHNGLMDVFIDSQINVDSRPKDAVVIACASSSYFAPHFEKSFAYPLVVTTNLLAPEAYVIKNVIEHWAQLKTDEQIRYAAAEAYNKYQKCGINGASRLFKTGW